MRPAYLAYNGPPTQNEEARVRIEVVESGLPAVDTDGLIVAAFEGEDLPLGAAEVDAALGGTLRGLIDGGDLKGKSGEIVIVPGTGVAARRVALIGLGKRAELTAEKVRVVAAEAARALRGRGAKHIASPALGRLVIGPAIAAQATVEGVILGTYKYARPYGQGDSSNLESHTLVANSDLDVIRSGAERGRVIAEATNLARTLQNEPANILTPRELAARAETMAKDAGLAIEVHDETWMKEQGMGALLGVAQGSAEPPRFIIIRYDAGDSRPAVGLVGKGITFDTGGVSIKPADGMELMKTDMSGGAAVIGAMQAIAALKPKRNVIGVIPTTENHIGGKAQRPGDVVRAFNGKTIEVINTDAEGRLILSDALGWAVAQGCTPIIDLATLTGAMTIALGRVRTGVFTNDQPTLDGFMKAGEASGERFWPFPLDEEYLEQIKSDVADVKNTGGRGGGACTAAALLKEMVSGTPWLHLDIAGTARSEGVKGYTPKGGTGVGVRTLVAWVDQLAQ